MGSGPQISHFDAERANPGGLRLPRSCPLDDVEHRRPARRGGFDGGGLAIPNRLHALGGNAAPAPEVPKDRIRSTLGGERFATPLSSRIPHAARRVDLDPQELDVGTLGHQTRDRVQRFSDRLLGDGALGVKRDGVRDENSRAVAAHLGEPATERVVAGPGVWRRGGAAVPAPRLSLRRSPDRGGRS